jgi:hypothetical protein
MSRGKPEKVPFGMGNHPASKKKLKAIWCALIRAAESQET